VLQCCYLIEGTLKTPQPIVNRTVSLRVFQFCAQFRTDLNLLVQGGLVKVDVWSGWTDLNRRPPEPHSGALPGCATPRV
jgi:hypothetical protein